MNLAKKWKIRKKLIKNVKDMNLEAQYLVGYIRYIERYADRIVDEFSVVCTRDTYTGVAKMVLDGRPDINVEVSILGTSILVRFYSTDEKTSIERNLEFSGAIEYDKLTQKPLVDITNTIDCIREILCNSILYTIKNHTKSWWKK